MTDRVRRAFDDEDDVLTIELGVSRRKLMRQISALGLSGGLAGLATTGTAAAQQEALQGNGDGDGGGTIPDFTRVPLVPPPTADQMDLSNPTDEERHMTFVTHNLTNQFFIPCIAGMNDGLHKLGWTGEMVGPSGNNQARQIEIMNTTIDRLSGSRDVLATTVLDESSYVAPVSNAIDQNIPVLQWNTTVDGWTFDFMMQEFGQVLPYVGQRAFSAGNAVGITAYEKAQEILDADSYTVLPCIAVPGHPALQARTDGFENSIGQQDNVTMLEELNVTTDIATATSRIQTRHQANPDINVILGSGFWAVAGGAQLVSNQGLQGEMIVGGFDLPESTLQAIRNGTATFTVGQDPYSQGYITTQLAYEYMDRGIPMKDYITGVSIIDESNIEFASQRSGSWDELRNWQEDNYDLG